MGLQESFDRYSQVSTPGGRRTDRAATAWREQVVVQTRSVYENHLSVLFVIQIIWHMMSSMGVVGTLDYFRLPGLSRKDRLVTSVHSATSKGIQDGQAEESLLSVECVGKRCWYDESGYSTLDDISFSVGHGELVTVVGFPDGCTALLRIAAGLEAPDYGIVRLLGANLANTDGVVGRRIVYCQASFSALTGRTVLDHVVASQLARCVSPQAARCRAEDVLRWAGVSECSQMDPVELAPMERVRVALARSLTASPRLLVANNPMAGLTSPECDQVMLLLRLIVARGVAVLMSVDDASGLAEVGRKVGLGASRTQGVMDHNPSGQGLASRWSGVEDPTIGRMGVFPSCPA